MNRVILKGRLTADPELKVTQSGVNVLSFSIAVNRRFSQTNETDFINCQAWRSTAEFISKYFVKGQEILLCGRLQVRSWEDDNGNKRYATDVVVDEVDFCGSKRTNSNTGGNESKAANGTPMPQGFTEDGDDDEEDLPF